MNKHWLIFIVLSVLALSSMGAAAQTKTQYAARSPFYQASPLSYPGTIRGYVFRDTNKNGVFDAGEEGIPDVYVTISYGDYQHTYYTGVGDPSGSEPGPGSYGPTPLQSGYWTVNLHVPDGYVATTSSELNVFVPTGGAATGANFGIYGSGPINYSAGTGVAMGGGAGILPQTGGGTPVPTVHWIALVAVLVGCIALLGTPWCVVQVRQARERWW
jgi:hypothetical protein